MASVCPPPAPVISSHVVPTNCQPPPPSSGVHSLPCCRYRTSQYVGAVVVLGGLAAALGPSLAQGAGGQAASDTALWSSVLILSCIPMCLSSVYKEKSLGDTEIDAIYLNYWVAVSGAGLMRRASAEGLAACRMFEAVLLHHAEKPSLQTSPPHRNLSNPHPPSSPPQSTPARACVQVWQFILGFPLLLPMAPASNLPISQIGSNLLQGAKCYAGFNSQPGDNCGLAPLFGALEGRRDAA